MAADKLAIYNEALGHLGSRELASLAENRDPRRRLDQAWAPAILYTLEQAPWSFAIRSVQLEPTPSIEPAFGYGCAYQKPDDWLKTVRICSDERFMCPLVRFTDESGYWWTDTDPLFVRFVSADPAYGLDPSRWSPSFAAYLAIRLAQITCQRITGSSTMMGDLIKLEKDERKRAKANDALNTPPVVPPMGSWLRARLGSSNRGEGNTSGNAGLVTTSLPQLPTEPIDEDIIVIVDGGEEG
jgi:hypothetical protein